MNKKPKQVAAGLFKSKCLKLMDEVQMTKIPLIVTKHGHPVVTIHPFEERTAFPYGDMKGRIVIKGDIIGPSNEEWNAKVDY